MPSAKNNLYLCGCGCGQMGPSKYRQGHHPRPTGERHHNWKGGEVFHSALGRWTIRRNGQQVLRYRAVMEEHLGRRLTPDEHVHHINGDRTDDRTENLRIVTNSEHRAFHGGFTEEQKALIRELYSEGVSQNRIAAQLGINQSSVSRLLHGRRKKAA